MNLLDYKKKTSIFLLLLSVWAFSACNRNFVPAMYLHDETYMAKPYLLPADSTQKYTQSIYATGKATTSQGDIIGTSVRTTSGMLQIHQAHSFRYGNLAYGIQGAAGVTEVPTPDTYRPQYADSGRKAFQSLACRIEGNLKAPFNVPNFEWRVLGVSFNYSKEFGNYLNFRQKLVPSDFLSYSRGADMYSWGISTELCWLFGKLNPDFKNTGFNFKLTYLQSRFTDFVYQKGTSQEDMKRFRRKEDMVFSFVFHYKQFDIIYQTISHLAVPIPIFFGISHGLQVSANLSTLLKKK